MLVDFQNEILPIPEPISLPDQPSDLSVESFRAGIGQLVKRPVCLDPFRTDPGSEMPDIFAFFSGMGKIFGDQGIVEVEHHVLFGLFLLDRRHIDLIDTAVRIERGHGGVSGRLPRDDGWRNDPDHVPGVSLAGGAAPGGDQIVVPGADQDPVGHLIEEIPAFEVADGADGILKMAVGIGFTKRVITLDAAGRPQLRHSGQRDDLTAFGIVVFDALEG